jgi:hypothetical protein
MHGHGLTVLIVKVLPIEESPSFTRSYTITVEKCLALAKFVSMMEENASEKE